MKWIVNILIIGLPIFANPTDVSAWWLVYKKNNDLNITSAYVGSRDTCYGMAIHPEVKSMLGDIKGCSEQPKEGTSLSIPPSRRSDFNLKDKGWWLSYTLPNGGLNSMFSPSQEQCKEYAEMAKNDRGTIHGCSQKPLNDASIMIFYNDYKRYFVKNSSKSLGKNKEKSTFSVFKSNKLWKSLPDNYLKSLSRRLNTPQNAKVLILLVDKADIFHSHIVKYADDDPVLGLIETAITLTGYGYNMANINAYAEAKRAWETSLFIRPRHMPAWAGLAVLSINSSDCKSASIWADKVLNYEPDPNSNDPIEAAEATLTEKEKEEAEDFVKGEIKDESLLSINTQLFIQMYMIKAQCSIIN